MSEKTIDLRGSTLYRVGFVIFIIACGLNSFDAYVDYVNLTNHLSSGGDPDSAMGESLLFLSLGAVLVVEGVGLVLFKWAKRAVAHII